MLPQDVLHEGESGGPRVEAYAQLDAADGTRTLFGLYLGAGLVARGLLTEPSQDALGVSISAGRSGHRARQRRGPRLRPWEVALELVYSWRIVSGLRVKPSLQYIVAPGGGVTAEDAFVGILRAALDL